jgi:hypothetical protein
MPHVELLHSNISHGLGLIPAAACQHEVLEKSAKQ